MARGPCAQADPGTYKLKRVQLYEHIDVLHTHIGAQFCTMHMVGAQFCT